MQNDAKRFRNLHGRDVGPIRCDQVVKVRVVPATLLLLVATSTSRFGGILKELGELDDDTYGCLGLIKNCFNK